MRRAYREVFEVGGGKVDDLLLQLRERHQAEKLVSGDSKDCRAEAGEQM